MLNLLKIVNLEFNSSIARYLLALYYKPGNFYKIPFGALKGFKLWYDRTINYHAVLGFWEKNNFYVLDKLFSRFLINRDKIVVYDVGANVGLYSLFFSRFGPNVNIAAFEAVPETVESLKRNLEINSINSVQIVDKAVADHDGHVSFFVGHHHKSSLVKDWASDAGKSHVNEIKVPSISVDLFASDGTLGTPDFIKIDVEGGGDKVLQGASVVIAKGRPIILIESHNAVEDNAIIATLAIFQYDAFRVNNRKWVKNKNQNYIDREGVWGTLLLVPQEQTIQISRCLQ